MNAVRLTPVCLSALLLAAHFLRAGLLLLVALSLVFPLLLLIRNIWAVRAVQLILAGGSLEWVRTLLALVDERQAAGRPWSTAAIILGAVAVLTAASALVFFAGPLKEWYRSDRSGK